MNSKTTKLDNIWTGQKLRKLFDAYFQSPLTMEPLPYLRMLPRMKGKQLQFEILRTLPLPSEYNELRDKHYTTSINDLIADAVSEFECLKDELQEWYDNLPESFQNGSKGEQLQEAINALENATEPDIPKAIGEIKVIFLPGINIQTRGQRCANACAMIDTANSTLEELKDTLNLKDERTTEEDELIEAAEELVSELQNISDYTDGVEFPTMFG